MNNRHRKVNKLLKRYDPQTLRNRKMIRLSIAMAEAVGKSAEKASATIAALGRAKMRRSE